MSGGKPPTNTFLEKRSPVSLPWLWGLLRLGEESGAAWEPVMPLPTPTPTPTPTPPPTPTPTPTPSNWLGAFGSILQQGAALLLQTREERWFACKQRRFLLESDLWLIRNNYYFLYFTTYINLHIVTYLHIILIIQKISHPNYYSTFHVYRSPYDSYRADLNMLEFNLCAKGYVP